MKYPKMQTLWKRNEKGLIQEGEYSLPEFYQIKKWIVYEKLHGTSGKQC